MNRKYTAEMVEKAVDSYIAERHADGKSLPMVGLALKLGCFKSRLWDWMQYSGEDPEEVRKAEAIKRYKQAAELELVDSLDDRSKSTRSMFLLKTTQAYSERQELDLRHSGAVSLVTGIPQAEPKT